MAAARALLWETEELNPQNKGKMTRCFLKLKTREEIDAPARYARWPKSPWVPEPHTSAKIKCAVRPLPPAATSTCGSSCGEACCDAACDRFRGRRVGNRRRAQISAEAEHEVGELTRFCGEFSTSRTEASSSLSDDADDAVTWTPGVYIGKEATGESESGAREPGNLSRSAALAKCLQWITNAQGNPNGQYRSTASCSICCRSRNV
jgi:hypothetical protein